MIWQKIRIFRFPNLQLLILQRRNTLLHPERCAVERAGDDQQHNTRNMKWLRNEHQGYCSVGASSLVKTNFSKVWYCRGFYWHGFPKPAAETVGLLGFRRRLKAVAPFW